jgi:hypothetical protein
MGLPHGLFLQGFKTWEVVMFENFDQMLATGVIVLGTLLLVVWTLIVRTRWGKKSGLGKDLEMVEDAKYEEGEKPASLVSEQIEERVKQILSAKGLTNGHEIDFGTAADGSLEIWVDGVAYVNVGDIPDTAIREAVGEAVEEFNRPMMEADEA